MQLHFYPYCIPAIPTVLLLSLLYSCYPYCTPDSGTLCIISSYQFFFLIFLELPKIRFKLSNPKNSMYCGPINDTEEQDL